MNLRILISNPNYQKVDFGDWDVYIFGTRPKMAADRICELTLIDDVITKLMYLPGEYSCIMTDGDSVTAFRGITSSYDIYYTKKSKGDLIIGDHFRDILSNIPVEDRTLIDSIGQIQLLLGTSPYRPYVLEVEKVNHGERVHWSDNGGFSTMIETDLSCNKSIGRKIAKERVNSYLNDVCSSRDSGNAATMLSGGVDSTLIHSYLQKSGAVGGIIHSPKYHEEMEYAKQASDLLDVELQWAEFEESDYVSLVENAIDATGHPLLHPQTPLIQKTFAETSYNTYFNGEFADSIFGKPLTFAYRIAAWANPVLKFTPKIHQKIGSLKDMRDELSYKTTDPRGYGLKASIHSDPSMIKKFYDDSAYEPMKKRYEYTIDRIPVLSKTGFSSHMHLGHCISFFQENTASLWRHAAHAHNKEMITPFSGHQSVKTSMDMDPSKRYVQKLQSKWLPKKLLDERVPEYNVDKKKLGSGVGIERYFQTGPLKNAFQKYDLPEFIPGKYLSDIKSRTDHIAWYAFSFSVWRDRILNNKSLSVFNHTDEYVYNL